MLFLPFVCNKPTKIGVHGNTDRPQTYVCCFESYCFWRSCRSAVMRTILVIAAKHAEFYHVALIRG